jgi:FtsH-binding integral membrane protein
MAYEYELDYPVAQSGASARATFIRRTYAHLAGAVLAFIGLEALLLKVVDPNDVFQLLGTGRFSWLIVLAAFMGASWLAQVWARSETSPVVQYLGLGLYVVCQALICLPLLLYAAHFVADKTLIPTAGVLTLAVFGGLTASVFVTKKDYNFLAPILTVGSFIALGVIVAGIIFGFSLGLFFSFAMVALLCGFILYETSSVLLHFRTDQHVAAALMLFSSIATLFWYILRILIILNDRR